MIAALLHSTNYQFSFYAMPTLVTSVGTLLLALLVLSEERFSFVSVSFLLVGLSITLWLGAFTFMYLAAEEPVALWWSRAAYLGAPFIPITIYQFTVAVLRIDRAKRWFLGTGWALSLVFSISILSTNWLIARVYHYWWGYYPQYGWLSVPYLIFFFGYMILSLWEYGAALRQAQPGTVHYRRVRAFMVAFGVAYLGSFDYLAKYGIALYPFGYAPIFVFLALAARAIWRYRLIDVTPSFAAQQIISTMTDALCVIDREGVICVANAQACRMLQRPLSDLVGASITALQWTVVQPEQLNAILTDGTAAHYETHSRDRDGDLRTFDVSASAVMNSDGKPAAVVCIARDVTERQRAEEALRHAHARTEKLLSSVTSILIWVDPSGRITHWNSIAEATFGITATDVVNQPLATCGIQWDSATVLAGITECRGADRPIRLDDVRFQRADGEQGYVGFTLVPVRAEREDALEVLLFGAEITERKRVDAMLRRQAALTQLLQTVAGAANQASTLEEAMKVCVDQVCASTSWPIGQVYLTSSTGELTLTTIRHLSNARQDEAFQKMIQTVGYTPGVGLPRRVLATKTPAWSMNLAQDTDVHWAAAAQECGIHAAFAFPVLIGQEVVAVLEFFSLEAREPDAQFLDVMANIGTQLGRVVERQRAEEEIRTSNKRLRELATLKDEFVAKASHELRTPLTSIKEGLSLLLDNALGDTTEEQRDFLRTMDGDIDRLTELINNMLDISKIETGRMRLQRQRLDVRQLIEGVLRSYQHVFSQRRILVECGELPPIFADQHRMIQVLSNLLSNAVKFTAEGGTIIVQARRQGTSQIALSVKDNGPGIAPQDLPKLFQKFSQVGIPVAGRPRGTGLGLVVCKELAELHKGRIEVASVVGEGTTFTAVLPVYSEAFALSESFAELMEATQTDEGKSVAVVAIDTAGSPHDGAPNGAPQTRPECVMAEVRKHLHRGDAVIAIEPRWVAVLAATTPDGPAAIVKRLQMVLSAHRLQFGAAMYPAHGADAQALFQHAMNTIGYDSTITPGPSSPTGTRARADGVAT